MRNRFSGWHYQQIMTTRL